MKNKVLSFLLAFILVLSLLPAAASAEGTTGAGSETSTISFEDVAAGAWYYNAVQSAVQGGLMTGESTTSFAPEKTLTRAMLTTVLYRLDGSKKSDKPINFTDINTTAWYYDAVKWAVANGIVSGYSDSVFGAEDNITRQQMAAMLYRYAKYKGRRVDVASDLTAYADSSAVADWAGGAMNWAVSSGLITGTNGMALSPGGSATRAEVATVLMRYVNGANLENRSFGYVSEFVKGNFDNFYKDSSDGLQKSITKEKLASGWKELSTAISSSGEYLGSTYAKNDVVSSCVSGAQYDLKVTIHYDSTGKPDGIQTTIAPKDAPAPQATAQWEEVPVVVGDMKLPGMLTLPKGVEKPPVVILVQGSGASDMNEAFGANHPFQDIAQGLAEQGVATLRYNKRTYQYPYGGCDSIEYEMLKDASAAVKLLSNDGRVDATRIFLLGHSLGGMMAPKMTADNPQIKGFISMAGSLRPLQDIILDQCRLAIQVEPSLTEQQKKDELAKEEAEVEKVKTLNDGGTGYILGSPTSYWKSLNAINGVETVKSLKVPMLILQGSADFQIYADKDYKLWQTTLSGRNNVDFKLYDGLSHMFMPNQIPANGGIDTSVYMAQNKVDTKVISDIAAWVKKQ